jgi:hypothetical protein
MAQTINSVLDALTRPPRWFPGSALLRLGAGSIAVFPATHTAVMRACAAACRRTAAAVTTHCTDSMTVAVRLQAGNCHHARKHYCCEELAHYFSPIPACQVSSVG